VLFYRRREDELRSKESEFRALELELEDRNWELQQRAAQVYTHRCQIVGVVQIKGVGEQNFKLIKLEGWPI
jgi:hypothetical protein